MNEPKKKVVVLGGGMAGVAAAWRLSDPMFEDQIESVTVYQRGWRLGGKGASSRATFDRIEEHGLHVWLGYYENAFLLLQQCYAELDRTRTDPDSPILTWTDALKPATAVGLEDRQSGSWRHWIGDFAVNDLVPGDGVRTSEMGPDEFVRRGLGLLQDFFTSMTTRASPETQRPVMTSTGWTALRGALGLIMELTRVGSDIVALVGDSRLASSVEHLLGAVQRALLDIARDDPDVRQTWELTSVVVATIRGLVVDGIVTNPSGFRALNQYDYREWISRHGASPEAVDSTLVRGLYDLVFGYADGDELRPGFAAGLGVFLSGKTFFDYKGAIFWKMQAGMGDVVFAPLYEVLARRGVRFEFFCNVENIGLTADGKAVSEILLGRQATLAPGRDRYEPLTAAGGLSVFPAQPKADQLAACPAAADSESWWARGLTVGQESLHVGEDFDAVVFALPVGMARQVTPELMAASNEWRQMVNGLGVVATQALQIWLRESEEELGWHRPGVTISGYVKPFDTWASMPQLRGVEQWPTGEEPAAIEYFCATLPTPSELPIDPSYPGIRDREVHDNARRFLDGDVGHYLPQAVENGTFRWDLLCGAEGEGPGRLQSQFWRANVDPSDLYVQSLPGTDHLRLRADQSGFDRLILAGDWTDNGVNAGCIEAATLSGLEAANAVLGRPLLDGTVGAYLRLNDRS